MAPHTVSPLQTIDADQDSYLSEKSVMGDPDILSHLLSLLTNKKTPVELQVYLLNFFFHVKQYKPFRQLIEGARCTELLAYLFGAIFGQKQDCAKD